MLVEAVSSKEDSGVFFQWGLSTVLPPLNSRVSIMAKLVVSFLGAFGRYMNHDFMTRTVTTRQRDE